MTMSEDDGFDRKLVTPEDPFPGQWEPGEEITTDGLPEGMHIELKEAPLGEAAPDGSVGIQVPINVIIDQVHQHWARQLADQIQRNAELAAALTVTNDALTEARSSLETLKTFVNEVKAEDNARWAAKESADQTTVRAGQNSP